MGIELAIHHSAFYAAWIHFSRRLNVTREQKIQTTRQEEEATRAEKETKTET